MEEEGGTAEEEGGTAEEEGGTHPLAAMVDIAQCTPLMALCMEVTPRLLAGGTLGTVLPLDPRTEEGAGRPMAMGLLPPLEVTTDDTEQSCFEL